MYLQYINERATGTLKSFLRYKHKKHSMFFGFQSRPTFFRLN